MDEQEKFLRSIDFSLKWEGGRNFSVVNGRPVIKCAAKNDTGGATAYGIKLGQPSKLHTGPALSLMTIFAA